MDTYHHISSLRICPTVSFLSVYGNIEIQLSSCRGARVGACCHSRRHCGSIRLVALEQSQRQWMLTLMWRLQWHLWVSIIGISCGFGCSKKRVWGYKSGNVGLVLIRGDSCAYRHRGKSFKYRFKDLDGLLENTFITVLFKGLRYQSPTLLFSDFTLSMILLVCVSIYI